MQVQAQHTQVHQVCLQQLPSTTFYRNRLCARNGGALLPVCAGPSLEEQNGACCRAQLEHYVAQLAGPGPDHTSKSTAQPTLSMTSRSWSGPGL